MLLKLVDLLIYDWAGFAADSRLGGAMHFFVYDSIKILLLLLGLVFIIGFARTYLPQDRLKQWINRGGLWGNTVAALLGAVTPFCSCSGIPIFIGLLKAGAPLGVAFSFLITSPIINEYLVVLMASEFGVSITLAYIVCGLTIGILAGALLGKMNLECYLEADINRSTSGENSPPSYSVMERLRFGLREAATMFQQIWHWILLGVAVGAVIHSYVPQAAIESIMEATGVFSVPIATVLGVPMYANCAAIVPVAVVIFEKGIPLGTALSFMMAMAALSLPEAIMLRRVMRLPLIAIFFGITGMAIIATGYIMNGLTPFIF